MDWRSSLFSKEKRALLHTIIAIILSFAVLFSGPAISGIIGNSTTTLFYYPFFKLKSTLESMARTSEENVALRASLTEMSTRLQLYNETITENKRLRALLGFVPPKGFKIVPAEIIGVYGSGIPNSVQINMGVENSIEVNQTVINRNGLAGRVAGVSNDYSVVYLLTDPRCRVAARISRSREQGIIRYNLNTGMYLDNLPRQGDVQVGDTVITSGLGGIFPEGLVIGIVKTVAAPEREFFYDITVEPAVDFNGLDELYVLVSED